LPISGPITIAIDSEFHGVETITIQAAVRLGAGTVVAQIYRASGIPEPSEDIDWEAYFPSDPEHYGRYFERLIVRPIRPITPDLSPGDLVRDLLDLAGAEIIPRDRGLPMVEGYGSDDPDRPGNLCWNQRAECWIAPKLSLSVVGHFLPADFFRAWGRDFLAALAKPAGRRATTIGIQARRLLTFVDSGSRRTDPILEFVRLPGGRLFAIHVTMRDTMLPFGPASLDAHSRTFLKLGKSGALTEADKREMRRAFHEKTRDAYGYALVDPVNTLLIHEQMQERDREIYRSFGMPEEAIPPLRSTLGSRVADFLVRVTARDAAGGSLKLASQRSLKALMAEGGVGHFERYPEISRYGRQTGEVHGGLLFSRTPTRFWHEAPGMLRDVDMAGCYNNIVARLHVYWGRPVIFEPGSHTITLREAVELVNRQAAPDAWTIRVTGDIVAGDNTLIPSTEDALTARNFRARQRARRRAAVRGFGFDRAPEMPKTRGTGKSCLYTRSIQSGIVSHPTWLMVQAQPPALRAEYERLNVESIIFYPKEMAARSGPEFDELVARYADEDLPWASVLDPDGLRIITTETIDASFVTLRFPIGDYARRIGEHRREARQVEGKGSGADTAWKVHANCMYGVLACEQLPTSNHIASNWVTAHARAEAFAMIQALNGFQVITDGCTYRRDQIPACTYAECLAVCPDYAVRRAESDSGIPFLDPAAIPDDDALFSAWYHDHVRRFYGVGGPEYEAFFATHDLEHKKTSISQSAAFDALATDGCGNYLKATRNDQGGWRVEDMAARSYGRESKPLLQDWIVKTYATDRVDGPPPVTEDTILLKYKEAGQKARAALEAGIPEVLYPLGMEFSKIGNYKAIKPSAFLFQTPEQRRTILKQIKKFENRTGCGLEAIALRRTYRGRREGSMTDIADEVYHLIREGGNDLTKGLNLNRRSPRLTRLGEARLAAIQQRKGAAQEALFAAIDVRRLDREALATGLVVSRKDQVVVQPD
jgi:hypothetical protein